MKRDFTVIIERDAEGWYVADVPALPGCHIQAKSLDELRDRVREVIELCLEETRELFRGTNEEVTDGYDRVFCTRRW